MLQRFIFVSLMKISFIRKLSEDIKMEIILGGFCVFLVQHTFQDVNTRVEVFKKNSAMTLISKDKSYFGTHSVLSLYPRAKGL